MWEHNHGVVSKGTKAGEEGCAKGDVWRRGDCNHVSTNISANGVALIATSRGVALIAANGSAPADRTRRACS